MSSEAPQSEPAPKYWAFISYSRQDRSHATWLIQALETYRVPPSLVGRRTERGPVPRRLVPVFRDRDELSSSPDLEADLEDALLRSRNLIVICSPNSARSDSWVNREIVKFKAAGRDDIHALIVDGVPHASDQPGNEDRECFPRALRYHVDANGELTEERTEPLAADLFGEDPRPRVSRRMAFLKLVAGLIDVDFDELWGRDRQRRRRRLLGTSAAALVSVLVLSALTVTGLNATRAELSSRLAQQATAAVRDQPDTALLLAVAAYNTSPTAAAYGSLLAAVDATTHLTTSFHDLAEVKALALTGDGGLLALAGCEEPDCTDTTLLVYDTATGGMTRPPIVLEEDQVSDLTFESSTGRLWAVLSSVDHRLVSLDLTQPSPEPEQIFFAGDSAITVALSPDGSLYAVNTDSPASRTSEFKLFPTGAGRRCGDLLGEPPVTVLRFSTSGDRLIVGTESADAYVVDTANCASSRIFSRQTQDAAFDEAGYLLTIMPDAWAYRWDLTETGRSSSPLDLIGVPINGYLHKFSSQASYLASRNGSEVLISDVATRLRILGLLAEEEENSIQAEYLRSDLSSLQPVRLKGHAGEPTRFRFSSDERYLATADDQGEVLVWGVQGAPLVEPALSDENEAERGTPAQDGLLIGTEVPITATVSQESLGCEDAILSPGCTLTTRLTLQDQETGEVIGSLETTTRQEPQRENLINTFTSNGDLLTMATDFSGELSGYYIWHINPGALVELACRRANRPLRFEDLATLGFVQGWRTWLVGTACPDGPRPSAADG